MSVNKEKPARGVQVGLLWRLLRNWRYNLAVVLDAAGWVLTYIAVQHLPLFFVESIIATNLVITAFLERIVLHTPLKKVTYGGTALILSGLAVMALAASPGSARHVSLAAQWWLAVVPLGVGLLAAGAGRFKGGVATIGVALLSGIAFGETSVISRTFPLPHPLWHAALNPAPYGLLASGFVGVLLFSTALQRAHATVVNACMTAAETFVPTLIGFILLGDTVRSGRWYDVSLGLALAIAGTVSLAVGVGHNRTNAANAKPHAKM